MDFTNLKADNGFIRQQDVFNRLASFRCPDDEFFVIRRFGAFSSVGVSYQNEMCTFFKVYTGNRDLYLYIRDMIQNTADQLESRFQADQWEEDETWTIAEAFDALEAATDGERA